jgi:hypothetical protein
VCQWLFDTVAGLRVTGRTFLTRRFGGTSPRGRDVRLYAPVAGSWERTASGWTTVTVLPTTADVVLPDGVRHAVEAAPHLCDRGAP